MILFASVASGLYIGLHEFNKASSESLSIEQTIIEEKITGANFYGDSQITGIHIENVGSKTVNLAATYIDNQLFNEISIYLSPKESCTIPLSPTQPYLPDSIISVTTKNGAKAMLLEADLSPVLPPSYDDSNKIFGPLQLEYRDFKYRTDLNTNWNDALDGWKVPKNTPVDWRIRVENVDVKERTIDLLKYSCLSLVTYGGGQRPWYIDITSITDLSGVQHSSRVLPTVRKFTWVSNLTLPRLQKYSRRLTLVFTICISFFQGTIKIVKAISFRVTGRRFPFLRRS